METLDTDKALTLLNKLLSAAEKAENCGKYKALKRIIYDANKVVAYINKSRLEEFIPVKAEIIEYEDCVKYETYKPQYFSQVDYNNLAIIAAKQNLLGRNSKSQH